LQPGRAVRTEHAQNFDQASTVGFRDLQCGCNWVCAGQHAAPGGLSAPPFLPRLFAEELG
jgi:hypothetical protein